MSNNSCVIRVRLHERAENSAGGRTWLRRVIDPWSVACRGRSSIRELLWRPAFGITVALTCLRICAHLRSFSGRHVHLRGAIDLERGHSVGRSESHLNPGIPLTQHRSAASSSRCPASPSFRTATAPTVSSTRRMAAEFRLVNCRMCIVVSGYIVSASPTPAAMARSARDTPANSLA